MPSSGRRRTLRLVLSAYKKFRILSAEPEYTVGVYRPTLVVRGQSFPAVKAREGAERSCRARRSRRGLRRGKKRARGGKPREPSPPRPKPTTCTNGRAIKNLLRLYGWIRSRGDVLKKRFPSEVLLWNDGRTLFLHEHPLLEDHYSRWLLLRERCLKMAKSIGTDPVLQHTYVEYARIVHGVRVAMPGAKQYRSGVHDLMDIVQRLKPKPLPVRKKTRRPPASQTLRGRKLVCTGCWREAPVFRLHNCSYSKEWGKKS